MACLSQTCAYYKRTGSQHLTSVKDNYMFVHQWQREETFYFMVLSNALQAHLMLMFANSQNSWEVTLQIHYYYCAAISLQREKFWVTACVQNNWLF